MKVFFAASYSGYKKFSQFYLTIYSFFEKKGILHLDDDVKTMTLQKFIKEGKKDPKNISSLFHKKTRCIDKADLCVFEVSSKSIGIGFLIERALIKNKPTIILYHKDYDPYFIFGLIHEQMVLKSYTKSSLKKILEEAYSLVLKSKESRFNFYATPKLIAFIEQKSKENGISQSGYIRGLLLEAYRKDNQSLSS